MKRDSEKSRKVWEAGTDVLHEYLTGKIQGSDKVKIAVTAMGHHARMIASEANLETNRLILAKMIYPSAEEKSKYIKASMPQMIEGKKD